MKIELIDIHVNFRRNSEIDWEFIIINNPIHNYLNKFELLELSLVTKRLRLKLCRNLFKDILVNVNLLSKQHNYFGNRESYEFENLTYWDQLKLFTKYNFSKDLAYKSEQIDTFITQSFVTLCKVAKYCESLKFEILMNAGYFLIPLTFRFINLKDLSINLCYIPLIQFNVILSKLSKLEALSLELIHFVKSTEDSALSNNIKFPVNLKKLEYGGIRLITIDKPQLDTINFVKNIFEVYEGSDLDLPIQALPSLEDLNITKRGSIINLTKFLEVNLQLKKLILPITQLSSVNFAILLKMKNLKNLSVFTIDSNFEVPYISQNIPEFFQLKILNLNLLTSSDFDLVTQLIKLTPNLIKLTLKCPNNNQFISFNQLINKLNYFSYSKEEKNLGRSNFIIKDYNKYNI